MPRGKIGGPPRRVELRLQVKTRTLQTRKGSAPTRVSVVLWEEAGAARKGRRDCDIERLNLIYFGRGHIHASFDRC